MVAPKAGDLVGHAGARDDAGMLEVGEAPASAPRPVAAASA